MITIKSAKVNGKPAKLVVKEGLTKQEQNLFLDLVEGSEFWNDYIILPIEQNTKEHIKNVMLDKIEPKELHTNGSFFVSSQQLIEKVQQAENCTQLSAIYEDYKSIFSI